MLCGITPAVALDTALTYQGVLADGDQPATGSYDLKFTLYDAASGESVVAGGFLGRCGARTRLRRCRAALPDFERRRGPSHTVTPGFYLGHSVDVEGNGPAQRRRDRRRRSGV